MYTCFKYSNLNFYSSTIDHIILGRCSPPVVSPNVTVDGYSNGVEGSQISFSCQSGLEPSESFVSTCISSEIWSPNPAEHNCTTPAELESGNYMRKL